MDENRDAMLRLRISFKRATDHTPISVTVSHDVYDYIKMNCSVQECYFVGNDGVQEISITGVKVVPGY